MCLRTTHAGNQICQIILLITLQISCCLQSDAQDSIRTFVSDHTEKKNSKPQAAAVHYSKFRKMKFRKVEMSMIDSSDGSATEVFFGKLKGLVNVKIGFKATPGDDSSRIRILKNDKLLKELTLPFIAYYMDAVAYVGDIDNDGRPDIKFTGAVGANGLGAELVSTIYLFNQGNNFRVVFFIDFWPDNEYDLDNDGKYEFIVTDHTFYKDHSYWVHNVYSFANGKISNQSKKFGYPLWTRHLNKTNNVIARRIPYKERLKSVEPAPTDLIIK